MLIGKPLKNVVKQTNTNGKNSNQDIDNEYIPIQIYARHFLEGQIYALEIAFSVNRQTDLAKHCMFERFNNELIEMFLTIMMLSQKPFVQVLMVIYSRIFPPMNSNGELLKSFRVERI
jgi:hypothetical protein